MSAFKAKMHQNRFRQRGSTFKERERVQGVEGEEREGKKKGRVREEKGGRGKERRELPCISLNFP